MENLYIQLSTRVSKRNASLQPTQTNLSVTEMMLAMHTVQAEVGLLSVALTQRLACVVLSAGQPEHLVQCSVHSLRCCVRSTHTHSKGVFRLYVLEQYVRSHVIKLATVSCFASHLCAALSTHIHTHSSSKQLCNVYL